MTFKTKSYDWLDSKTNKPQYGFKIYVTGEWCLACVGARLILFDTPEERDKAMKEMSG